jgi:hypothetical protein
MRIPDIAIAIKQPRAAPRLSFVLSLPLLIVIFDIIVSRLVMGLVPKALVRLLGFLILGELVAPDFKLLVEHAILYPTLAKCQLQKAFSFAFITS